MRSLVSRALVLTALTAATFAPSGARADEPQAQDDGKAAGDLAFDRRDYEAAIAAYSRAYAREKSPALLYNRGRAHQALKHYARALEDFEAFQRDAPPALLAKVPALHALVDETRAHVCRLAVTSNVAGARVFVAGEDAGRAPIADRALDEGPTPVRVEADGYVPFAATLSCAGGGKQEVAAVLPLKAAEAAGAASAPVFAPATPTTPPTTTLTSPSPSPSKDLAQAPPPRRRTPWLYASAGAALVTLGTAGVFRIVEQGHIDAMQDAIARGDFATARDARSSAVTTQNVAIGSAIAGGVFLGVTAYLWFHGDEGAPSVAIGITPGGARIGGSF